MTRYLFAPEPFFRSPDGTIVQLGASQPFKLYTDQVGGTEISDCTTDDSITPLPRPNGAFVADAYGQPPRFYGPDDQVAAINAVSLWIDGGGPTRYQIVASDLLANLLTAAIDWLAGNFPGGGGGGGLPSDVTLEDIPNGPTRVAMTQAERDQLSKVPTAFLKVGTAATDAKRGDYAPTAKDVKAVQAVDGDQRTWKPRPSTQGAPTAAEGALDGDLCYVYDV